MFHVVNGMRVSACLYGCICVGLLASRPVLAQTDPGPRLGTAAAGEPFQKLTANELAAFLAGLATFSNVDSVTGTLTSDAGLGPRFNLDSCAGCHANPAVGGSSPAVNPQIAVATKAGAQNVIPSFISISGPVREARFVRGPNGQPDGGVHDLFVITGRTDAPGCEAVQPNFAMAVATNNVVFRIPTPLYGAGLIEAIDDVTILANLNSNAAQKQALGIGGQPNTSVNDGSLTRFGWKAQNKSLMIFAGEAYNVEQGVTNDLFPNERDSTPGCRFNATPEDTTNINLPSTGGAPTDLLSFTNFMRFLSPPTPAQPTASTMNGQALFASLGCALCHTPTLTTASSGTAALSNQAVNLFSDLALHHMGQGLADGITQGLAGPDQFRTAPLWGLGQRLFFLHDGRAKNLNEAIGAHASQGSEASMVINHYNQLAGNQKQDLLNFLRSL